MSSGGRLQDMQAQADEVVSIVRDNVEKLIEREGKLSDLDERADNLAAEAEIFNVTATQVHKKYWWQNVKASIGIGVAVSFVLLIIIILVIIYAPGSSSSTSNHPATTPATTTTTTTVLSSTNVQ